MTGRYAVRIGRDRGGRGTVPVWLVRRPDGAIVRTFPWEYRVKALNTARLLARIVR
jgi:hypothetical protein